jgi:hypothetical protein
MNVQIFRRLAGVFPYLILFTYIAGCIFCLMIDRMSYLINGSILAVPAIIGAFTFVFIKKKDVDLSGNLAIFPYGRLISPQMFLAVYLLSILAFLLTPSDSVLGLLMVVVPVRP